MESHEGWPPGVSCSMSVWCAACSIMRSAHALGTSAADMSQAGPIHVRRRMPCPAAAAMTRATCDG